MKNKYLSHNNRNSLQIYLKLGKKYLGKMVLDYDKYLEFKSHKLDKLFLLKTYVDSIFKDIEDRNMLANSEILENNLEKFLFDFKDIELQTKYPDVVILK